MNTSIAPRRGGQGDRTLTLGSGWAWPALLATLFVVLVYVPSHPSRGGMDEAAASLALIYILGLSLMTPRLLRGVILRHGGGRGPIVLLGRGPAMLTEASIRARWRLAAVAASTAASLAAAFVAARLAVATDPTSYQHGVVALAFGANLAIAAGILVPAPGFAGWAALLGLVDGAGIGPDRRVRRAARIAQVVGVPIMLAVGVAAALVGDPMFLVIAFVLALITWTQSTAVVGRDATAQFLAAHRAGEIVRPIIRHVDPEETLDGLLAYPRADHVVTTVEVDGCVLGAVGPRQVAGEGSLGGRAPCRDVMIPLAALRPLPASSPAADLLPMLGAYGFALVTGPDGLCYVEVSGLVTQIRIWMDLRDRGVARRFGGR
jgi:hypothetical protein